MRVRDIPEDCKLSMKQIYQSGLRDFLKNIDTLKQLWRKKILDYETHITTEKKTARPTVFEG